MVYLVPAWAVGALLNTRLFDVFATYDLNNGVDSTPCQLTSLEHVDTHLKVHHLVGQLVSLTSFASLRLLGASIQREEGSVVGYNAQST